MSGCVRRIYRETRLCLALLYGLLSQYRLREAQELGDHMARVLLQRTGHLNNSTSFFFFFSINMHKLRQLKLASPFICAE